MSDLARDQIALPAPWWFPLVLLAVPGVLVLGHAVARLAIRGRGASLAAAPAVAIAIWLSALQLGSRASTSFYLVAGGSLLVLGVAGYALIPAHRAHLRAGRPPAGAGGLVIATFLVTVLVIPAIWAQELFDRDGFGGHYAFIAQILNDVIPPREPTFTDQPLQYHLGIDYLVAATRASTHLPLDRVFDMWATLLWAYTAVCGALVARTLFGVRRLWIPAVAVTLGGGLPWWIGVYDDLKGTYNEVLPDSITMYGALPTVGQNMLQPPWLVGVPLFLVLIAVIARGRWDQAGAGRTATIGLTAVLVFGLAMAQTALLAVGVIGVVVVVGWRLAPVVLRQARCLVRGTWGSAPGWPAGAGALLGATLLGVLVATAAGAGLVSTGAGRDVLGPATFVLAEDGLTSQFAVKQIPTALRWSAFSMVVTFGVLLPLAVVAHRRLRRPGHAGTAAGIMLAASLVGMVVLNVVRHTTSWDVLKFGSVPVILLSLLGGAFAAALVDGPAAGARGRVAGAAALAGICAGGALYLGGFWKVVLSGDAVARPTTYTALPDPDGRRAISYIRERIALGEVVICEPTVVDACGELGGFPQLYFTGSTAALYSAKDRRQIELLTTFPDQDFRRYLDANVRWALVPRTGSAFARTLVRAQERLAIAERRYFGPWQVVRFTPENAFNKAPFPATGN